jgi:hypothetical protein
VASKDEQGKSESIVVTGYDNLLAFANPDRSVVIMMQDDLCQDLPVRVKAGDKVIGATLEADSFNTLWFPRDAYLFASALKNSSPIHPYFLQLSYEARVS